jgi:hypothetical protein
MKLVMMFAIIVMSGCTLLLGDFTVENPPVETQRCGPTSSTGNCFNNNVPSDASDETPALH